MGIAGWANACERSFHTKQQSLKTNLPEMELKISCEASNILPLNSYSELSVVL